MGTFGSLGSLAIAVLLAPPIAGPRLAEQEPSDGTPSLAIGGVTLGVGIALTTLGALAADGRFYRHPTDPLSNHGHSDVPGTTVTILGATMIVGGVVLLAIGGLNRRAYNEWKARSLAPAIGRTRSGAWTVGFELRF